MDLYNKRYKTLAEHRAAVAARKTLDKGKNIGPVANADAYGSKIKKSPTAAVRSASTSTNSAKTTKSKAKPAAKSKAKITPPKLKATAKKGDGSVKAIKVKRAGSTEVKNAVVKPTKKAVVKPNLKDKKGTARGGKRASNNNRGRIQTSRGPKAGDTRRTRIGTKYVTQMYDGKKWVTGKVGGKG